MPDIYSRNKNIFPMKIYDDNKIRPIPGIPNHWLTRDGIVYDSLTDSIYGCSLPGMLDVRVRRTTNKKTSIRIGYVYADDTYFRVWGVKPPKDIWINAPSIGTKRMSIGRVLNLDIVKTLEWYEPVTRSGSARLKIINEILIGFLRERGFDPIKVIKDGLWK